MFYGWKVANKLNIPPMIKNTFSSVHKLCVQDKWVFCVIPAFFLYKTVVLLVFAHFTLRMREGVLNHNVMKHACIY